MSLEFWPFIEYVCQCNLEIATNNFVKPRRYLGHSVLMCILPGYSDSVIFLGVLTLLNLEFMPFIKISTVTNSLSAQLL